MTIVGMSYLMNYAGLAYTLGFGVASAGAFFGMRHLLWRVELSGEFAARDRARPVFPLTCP